MVGEVDGGGAKMTTGAIAGHGKAGGIGAVFFGVLLNVSDCAIHVFDDVGHGIWFLVAVIGAKPAVIHADHNVFAAANQFTGQAAHHVFAIHRPAAAVNNHDARQIPGAVGRIDVVFERFDARLGIDHVVNHLEAFQRLFLDE